MGSENSKSEHRDRSRPSASQPRPQPQTSTQQGAGQYPRYPQHQQTTTTQAAPSHPTLERTRSSYNYANQDSYATKESSPSTLYPNLNTCRPSTPRPQSSVTAANTNVRSSASPNTNVRSSASPNTPGGRSETAGFVVVDSEKSLYVNRPRPKPSAPPASELQSPELNVRSPPPVIPVRPNNILSPASTSAGTAANNRRPIYRGRAADDQYNCPTCLHHLGTTIFQCQIGHSSCQRCRQANRACGKCGAPLTNMRNIALEGILAEQPLVTKTSCPNIGCKLSFNDMDMQNHLNECPFGETDCPMGKIFGQCSLRYKIDNLISHFDAYHKEQRTADVGKEMFIFNICMETQKVFLVKMGSYHFLVHVKVSDVDRMIYMAVQLFGSACSASKWTYEIHVYNKRQPRRKFQYTDNCLSVSTPVYEIFYEKKCAALPLPYAMTFVNESSLTYKFFIKKNEGNWRERNRGRVKRHQNE